MTATQSAMASDLEAAQAELEGVRAAVATARQAQAAAAARSKAEMEESARVAANTAQRRQQEADSALLAVRSHRHGVRHRAPVACLNRVRHAAGRRLLSQSQLELKQQQKLLAELHQAEGHARGEYDSIKSTLEALGQTKAELEKSVSSLAEQRQQLTRLVKAEQEKVAHATRVRGGVAGWSPAPALADQCAACVPPVRGCTVTGCRRRDGQGSQGRACCGSSSRGSVGGTRRGTVQARGGANTLSRRSARGLPKPQLTTHLCQCGRGCRQTRRYKQRWVRCWRRSRRSLLCRARSKLHGRKRK